VVKHSIKYELSIVQQITNSKLSESLRIHASLSVCDGGLECPGFVISAASMLSLQSDSDILPNCVPSDKNSYQSYLLSWSAQFRDVPENLSSKQPISDCPGVLSDKAVV